MNNEINSDIISLYENNAPKLVGKFISLNEKCIKFFGTREDMQQELLLRIWKVLCKFNKEKSKFSTFVFVICKNVIYEKYKHLKYEIDNNEIEELGDDYEENNIMQQWIDKQYIEKAKIMLPKESYLYYFKQKNQKEIGKEFGISQVAISKKINKQIQNFKKDLHIML